LVSHGADLPVRGGFNQHQLLDGPGEWVRRRGSLTRGGRAQGGEDPMVPNAATGYCEPMNTLLLVLVLLILFGGGGFYFGGPAIGGGGIGLILLICLIVYLMSDRPAKS
jgi:hypothetical protein